ncbi:MAG: signal peptidase II [Anaerolineales bacterium]|nr:signal peptidase II [Anaerolineales bacterium]
MSSILSFLKPSWLKFIFLIELPIYLLIELFIQGQPALAQSYVLLIPLGFYYLVACILIYLHEDRIRLESIRIGVGIALLLIIIDQSLKMIILNKLNVGEALPLIPGILYLTHAQNIYGSWLVQTFNLDFIGHGLLIALVVISLLFTISVYRYYSHTGRSSLLADMAFVFFLAAFISAFTDIAWRGLVVDFIQLPGYVIADFKDIYLWFGAACLVAELFDNPNRYWKMSIIEYIRAIGRVIRFQFQSKINH